jgi:hypothetical protein
VHSLRDTASADAYCALGGCAVSPKVAQLVGERLGLQAWAALVVGDTSRHGSSSRGSPKNNVNLEEKRGELLQVLLKVYMSGGYVPHVLVVNATAYCQLAKRLKVTRRACLILKGENWMYRMYVC